MLSELSVDGKYAVLAEGIYDYFNTNFGAARGHRQNKQQSRLARQVNEARALKNAARRELMWAKKSTSLSQEQVSSVARKFFLAVQSHNKFIASRGLTSNVSKGVNKIQPATNAMRTCGGSQGTYWTMTLPPPSNLPFLNPLLHLISLPSTSPRHGPLPNPPCCHLPWLQWFSSIKRISPWLR